MNIPVLLRYLTVCCLTLVSSLCFSQHRDSYNFKIESGEVSVTPAYCAPGSCNTTSAAMSGTFVGFLPGGARQLFFTSSSVNTDPHLFFELPSDPNEDSGGVSRSAKFSFDGKVLKVAGEIDSRAFDGPLVEYEFIASVTGVPGSDGLAYYTARPDLRKCMSPMCGGYFVKAVNKRKTQCADGTRQRECYVSSIEAPNSPSGPGLKTPLFLLGKIVPQEIAGFGKFGVFKAKLAQIAASEKTAGGLFYATENNGIVCISDPCFSYDQEVLNRQRELTVSSINFDSSGAAKEKIAAAREMLAEGETLYASGKKRRYEGLAGKGVEFVIHQFYLPVQQKVLCEEGYSFKGGACISPYGCKFPQLEFTGYSGVAIEDPVTGELTSEIHKSCVDACELPAVLESAGQCVVYYP